MKATRLRHTSDVICPRLPARDQPFPNPYVTHCLTQGFSLSLCDNYFVFNLCYSWKNNHIYLQKSKMFSVLCRCTVKRLKLHCNIPAVYNCWKNWMFTQRFVFSDFLFGEKTYSTKFFKANIILLYFSLHVLRACANNTQAKFYYFFRAKTYLI